MHFRDGYKITELGEIPVEWEVVKFYDCVDITNGQVNPLNEPYIDYPHIGPANIEKFTGRLLEYNTARQDQLTSGKYLFDETDVLYGKINPQLGKVAFPQIKGVCSADVYPIRAKSCVSIPSFIYYSLLIPRFFEYSTSVSTRTGIPKINRNELSFYQFILPTLPEQQKIAGILSTVDDHISETDSLIEKTKILKQGMMQHLLTKGIGHTEFKDTEIGRIPVEWEVIPVGKYINNVSRKNRDGQVTDVVSVTKHNGIVDSMSYFKNQVYSDNLTTYKIIRRDEFAFPPIHLNEGSIGYLEHLEQAVLSPMYTVFSVNQSFLDNYFLFGLLKSHKYIDIYSTFIEGTVERRGAVSFDKFSGIKIPLPPLPEQKEITSILTSIDDQTDVYQTKLTALTKLKSTLIQQLLTGKTRVKI